MHHGGSTARARRVARYARMLPLAGLLMTFGVLGFAATPSLAMKPKKERTTWLCRPHKEDTVVEQVDGKDESKTVADPCEYSRTATVLKQGGETAEEVATKVKKPPIDCFYVYPTVSSQEGENATTTIEEEERVIAIDQVSRFSQVCRVYAPMYPQLTLGAIKHTVTKAGDEKAFFGVLNAFEEYMAKYNKGRPFVLIGHSQGSLMLEALISLYIEAFHPEYLKQMVSALLMGGNVLVPEGQLVGGTFKRVPACQAVDETGCVVAYSTFLKEPPEDSYFGRENSPLLEGTHTGEEVVCVNPTIAEQNGEAGALRPYASTEPFPTKNGLSEVTPLPEVSTPWATAPGLYSAQCHKENGASWLQVNQVGTLPAKIAPVEEQLGPEWGLHLYDINIALGNLVEDVALQATAYGFEH